MRSFCPDISVLEVHLRQRHVYHKQTCDSVTMNINHSPEITCLFIHPPPQLLLKTLLPNIISFHKRKFL